MKFHVVMAVPQANLRTLASDLVMECDVIAGDSEAAQGLALNYLTDTSFRGLAHIVSCVPAEETLFDIVRYNQLLLLAGADHQMEVLETGVPESEVPNRVSYWTSKSMSIEGALVQARPVGWSVEQAQERISVSVDAQAIG